MAKVAPSVGAEGSSDDKMSARENAAAAPAATDQAAKDIKDQTHEPKVLAKAEAEELRVRFANTRQHVAERFGSAAPADRFANTRLNAAVIAEGSSAAGARFTLTRQRVALAGSDAGDAGAQDGGQDPQQEPDTKESGPKDAGDLPADVVAKVDDASPPPAPDTGPSPAPAGALNSNGKGEGDTERTALPRAPWPTGVPPAEPPPEKVPVDSSKTFVGPNGTYYDEAWRWMDWRGSQRSWNWAAALSFGHWFAYRRLGWAAGLYLVWLAVLVGAAVNGVHVVPLVLAQILVMVLCGMYANTIYGRVFRKAVAHVTEKGVGDYQALRRQLGAAGGVRPGAVWLMAAATAGVLAAVLCLSYWLQGGLSLTFWLSAAPLPR